MQILSTRTSSTAGVFGMHILGEHIYIRESSVAWVTAEVAKLQPRF